MRHEDERWSIGAKVISSVKRFFRRVLYLPMPRQQVPLFCRGRISGSGRIATSFLKMQKSFVAAVDRDAADFLFSMYLSHRFDLLGSGWVKNIYEARPLGVEGLRYEMRLDIDAFDKEGLWLKQVVHPAHWKRSAQIWQLVDAGYVPIDWQSDLKSGYRWSAKRWYMDQEIGHKPGVDIKVPWELARMQHLPQMAAFAFQIPEMRGQLTAEFRNQVLDFIAANPPRTGVNWRCTMDAAIRGANLLVAHDIFKQLDRSSVLDSRFESVFSTSIIEHGRHIATNLECNGPVRTNHYLADIAGLLFVSAYLESSRTSDKWLAFAIMELVKEAESQFHRDGSNFEASTSYHRLSGEILVYSVALVLGIDKQRFDAAMRHAPKFRTWVHRHAATIPDESWPIPESVLMLLKSAAAFTVAVTKPTGRVAQIGDNDSGRFLKFSPIGEFICNREAELKYWNLRGYNELLSRLEIDDEDGLYWDEDDLNHSPFVSAVAGLLGREVLGNIPVCELEESIVRSLCNGRVLSVERIQEHSNPASNFHAPIGQEVFTKETVLDLPGQCSLTHGSETVVFPDFGLIVLRSKRVHLVVMAGHIGQHGSGGHAHNDKGSFELNVDGEDVVVDAGTYLYTASPTERNIFRGTRIHNTITAACNTEQCEWQDGQDGLFRLKAGNLSCSILNATSDTITVSCSYGDVRHLRAFRLLHDKLVISDQVNQRFTSAMNRNVVYSNGYGKLIVREGVKAHADKVDIDNLLLLLPRE